MDGVNFSAEQLVDWRTARAVGARAAGTGAPLSAVDRARLFEDFAEVVPEAERIAGGFTGIEPNGYRSRAWVMTRNQWLGANLRGFERALEPFAKKLMAMPQTGALAKVRRHVLGAQLGGLLGYLGRRVLGQYDMFLPPDDDGLIYFVGPNVAGIERKFQFPQRDFRMWIALHEVTHRLQFGGAPWLRPHLTGLMDTYLNSVEIDPGWLVDRLQEAVREVRSGGGEYRGFGWVFLLMTPDQRDVVRKMQSAMSLLEGHASFVMDDVGRSRIKHAEAFQRMLHQRRTKPGIERAFQKAIGFDVKVAQYDMGQRFVQQVVDRVGMDKFNLVWESSETLPTLEEIARPESWVSRVAAA
jgi:coenzyme F420 biosynthesis associated uncharacterized protein